MSHNVLQGVTPLPYMLYANNFFFFLKEQFFFFFWIISLIPFKL
jgi:hypothetical protein